jgi:hypothetical protein
MNIVQGSTVNEDRLIKGIQAATGALVDGEIGTQTLSDIACCLGAECFPLTLQIYGAPVIIAPNIVPFAAKGKSVSRFTNCMSGSFLSGTTPWSILIQDGYTIHGQSCHNEDGKPESVIYRLTDGTFGIARVRNVSELPEGIRWAVGGLGLLDNYNPTAEGFSGRFSDVLRRTNHAMLGVKNGYCYMVYCANKTAAEVNKFARQLGLQIAIMLDGGHVAAINGGESFARINTSQRQYYLIQGER